MTIGSPIPAIFPYAHGNSYNAPMIVPTMLLRELRSKVIYNTPYRSFAPMATHKAYLSNPEPTIFPIIPPYRGLYPHSHYIAPG